MSDILKSAAAAALAQKASSVGKPASGLEVMGGSLPSLSVRALEPGMGIKWEDFNYPACFPLIHFDILELPFRLRKTVRLLNISFLLTIFICAVNVVDTIVLMGLVGLPAMWVVQSLLNLVLLPTAQFGTFYMAYRGLAGFDMLLVHRFQLAQLMLCILGVVCATVPYQCINGLLRLAFMESAWGEVPGVEAFGAVAVIVESMLWMLSVCLGLLNLVQVRRVNVLPCKSGIYSSPPTAR
mmetsp:Transcript_149200/g.477887  ORF Transcript_149200/g.477887 Transcript_149200/m.477887 type:complete len:239 (-) Transcript_149200:110-826(-)